LISSRQSDHITLGREIWHRNNWNERKRGAAMRNRKQQGQIIRIGNRWYVRYWEYRNIGGIIQRKRVTHFLGYVTTRGRRPPADIKTEAERHMASVNRGTIP